MITASHVSNGCKKCNLNIAYSSTLSIYQNPKDDNGYKVYWENACQIIPPHDSGIAALIEQNLEPWIWDEKLALESPLSQDPAKEGVIESYFEELHGLSAFR